jgi:hypothetical protein
MMSSLGSSCRAVHLRLTETLGQDGWRVMSARRGVKARWRWLSVKIERRPDGWRARLREGFPRITVAEHTGSDPFEAMDVIVQKAQQVQRFEDGRLGLVYNPSKSWLGHRTWMAVRSAQ